MICQSSFTSLRDVNKFESDSNSICNISNIQIINNEAIVRKESKIGSICFNNRNKQDTLVKAKRRNKVINTVSQVHPDALLITKQEIRINLDKDSSYVLDESSKFYRRKDDNGLKNTKLTISTTLTIFEDVTQKSSENLFDFDYSFDEKDFD